MQQIAEREVDHPIEAGKGHRRFGPVAGQDAEFIHPAAGQDEGYDIGHGPFLYLLEMATRQRRMHRQGAKDTPIEAR
jgi:hypothetical protein